MVGDCMDKDAELNVYADTWWREYKKHHERVSFSSFGSGFHGTGITPKRLYAWGIQQLEPLEAWLKVSKRYGCDVTNQNLRQFRQRLKIWETHKSENRLSDRIEIYQVIYAVRFARECLYGLPEC